MTDPGRDKNKINEDTTEPEDLYEYQYDDVDNLDGNKPSLNDIKRPKLRVNYTEHFSMRGDPNFTNEAVIKAKLKAHIAGLPDGGCDAIAPAYAATANGASTRALKVASTAQGVSTIAAGVASNTHGISNIAAGMASTAQGYNTTATGLASIAQGISTNALGAAANAEGEGTNATGEAAHAEGINTTASGQAAHAEGLGSSASGGHSHSEGFFTNAASQEGAHIMGKYGDATFPYSWHLANGADANRKGLAAVIKNNGQGIADQGWATGNADIAEMFETLSGKNIPPGYFVTLEGDKIRKAHKGDDYILGVTSATPAFLGDAEELRWKGKYVRDKWRRIKYRKVTVPGQRDKNGTLITPERTEMQPVINPEWNGNEEYTPRSQRPEWVPVSALGKVLVRDDGTCSVNGYCMPNNDGIAAASKEGYRVIKRCAADQVLIWFR